MFQLRKDLASLSQGTKSITAYFTIFRGLIDELDCLSPIPRRVCTNSTCSCNNAQKLDAYEQYIKLSQFFMGHNEHFTATRGQILLMNPLPNITHAYSMLLQEENQCNFATQMSTTVPDNLTMNVRINSSNVKETNRKVVDSSVDCDSCKRTGHLKEKCFVLHGYPNWHSLYGQPKPKLRTNVKPKAIVTTDNTVTSFGMPASDNTEDLFEKQCQKLIAMLQFRLKYLQRHLQIRMQLLFEMLHGFMPIL